MNTLLVVSIVGSLLILVETLLGLMGLMALVGLVVLVILVVL